MTFGSDAGRCAGLTWKKAFVEPLTRQPYSISVCLARSSAVSMGYTTFSTVKKAAKLAVYDEIMMSVKKYQIPAMVRVDIALRCTKHELYNQ